jgi:Flp pilus assembly protein TadB
MAGRHGVPPQERRTHSRQASGQRRRRAQRRDALQPWRLWLAVRGLLALIVLAACGWSVLLLTRHQGGSWPVVAVVAGALSLLMIGLDVRARRRQRAQLRRRAIPRAVEPPRTAVQPPPPAVEPPPPAQPFVPEPPPRPGRHSHRA